ncbi:metallophosphoesterase [Bifidobacterium moukalabense]|uniref:metallophosphoesterase n=1 Tax=Bifidobacterium moukalabense TaxID=1333651 RepID=UPI0010F5250A|nr:metallophosphoesterase [Bifidobacterium moukalabense]
MTELQHAAKAASTRPRIQPAEEGDGRPLSISARLGRLQFHQSGKFRVLQFADIQDGPKVSADTIKLIEASLDATRPDVVIFTGNQIAGYDSAYSQTMRKRRWNKAQGAAAQVSSKRYEEAVEQTHTLVRSTVEQLVHPLAERGIPWAVTFGNHDFQCGLDNAELERICQEFPGCLNPASARAGAGENDQSSPAGSTSSRPTYGSARQGDDAAAGSGAGAGILPGQRVYGCEPGTFALPVMNVNRTRNVLGLVLVDSGDYARSGGYGSPSAAALRFLADVPHTLAAEPQGTAMPREVSLPRETLPCMVFQHFAIPQYYDLLKPVVANAARAIEGYRTFAGNHYVLDENKTQPGSYLGEGISCPDADSGEYAVLRDGGYFAISAGHDHRNAFVGTVAIPDIQTYARTTGESVTGAETGSVTEHENENKRENGNRTTTETAHGLMMIASPTSGFGSYGPVPEKRAARLFEFDIRHPYEPRTQLLEYGELVGKPSAGKAYAYGMTSESKPDSEGMDLLHRPTWWSKLISRFKK